MRCANTEAINRKLSEIESQEEAYNLAIELLEQIFEDDYKEKLEDFNSEKDSIEAEIYRQQKRLERVNSKIEKKESRFIEESRNVNNFELSDQAQTLIDEV